MVYDALFGGHLVETGLQASWVAPLDTYLNFGVEVTGGSEYPSGENSSGNNGLGFFAKTGGDISNNSSWKLGASYYQSKFDVREAGSHGHGDEEEEADNELLDGEVDIAGIDFVYKWAPQGNSKKTNIKLQGEYFIRNENGDSEFSEGGNTAEARYDGKQKGFYLQGTYQFKPAWRVGLRYDYLEANNKITNFNGMGIDEDEFLEESGLVTEGNPKKSSIMLDYSPSHFSRIRLQYNSLDNGHDEKNYYVVLQYTMSLGAHGAHSF